VRVQSVQLLDVLAAARPIAAVHEHRV
jgi:hypothetical protein